MPDQRRVAVANTSPLMYLHQCGLIDLLPKLYPEVLVLDGGARGNYCGDLPTAGACPDHSVSFPPHSMVEVTTRGLHRAFVDAFRAGAQRLREHTSPLADLFPLWTFPPALPFNAPA